jgi:DNA-binding GntR family transcriptional regulator
MLLVCMNRSSATGQAIARTGRFAVNILSEDQGSLAKRFATKAPDKFDSVRGVAGRLGQPLIAEALAQLECEVMNSVTAGTHVVFLAEVLTATASKGSPLAYYRGEFGRLELTNNELVREGGTRLSSQVSWSAAKDAVRGCSTIELGAVHAAGGRASSEAIDELRALMRATLEHIDVGNFNDVDRSVRAYCAFHEAVVGLAGSPSLVHAFRGLSLAAIMMRTFRPHTATELDAAFGHDHRELVDALAGKDSDLGAEIVGRHYVRFEQALRGAMRVRAQTYS